MLSPGVVLNGRYQLNQRIAAGGMGEVWGGDDLLLGRRVAVKVLLPALMSDSDFITRFRSEARMMAALRHPGIVQVYDYGENAAVGGHRLDYLVMEFIDGTPLSKRIQEAGRLGAAETLTMVAQVADALQAAHEAGIIHRDVKPSNLLVRPGGAIVLVDFGVARSLGVTGITSTNVVLGSAHYMAPEQAEGRPVTAATDVYALGAVAFSCLAGRPPYVGDNPLAILTQLVHGAPPVLPPDVPAAAASVVLRALARDPAHRFPSAAALAGAARTAPNSGSQAPPTAGGFPQNQAAYGGSARHPHPPRPAHGPAPHSAAAGVPAWGTQSSGRFPPTPQAYATGATRPGPPTGATRTGTHGFTPGSASVGPHTGAHGFNPGSAAAAPGQSFGAAAPVPGFGAGHASTGTGFGAAHAPTGTGFGAAHAPTGTGFGAGHAPTGAAHGSSTGAFATSAPAKSRKLTVLLAAAAVVAVVAGVGLVLGDRVDTLLGASEQSIEELPAGDEIGEPQNRTTTPAKKTKPTKKADPAATAKPSDPAPSTGTPEKNAYEPAVLCGDGFQVVESKELRTSAGVLRGTIYLLHHDDDETNCVVTLKETALDRKTAMSATLQVEGDETVHIDKGTYEFFAGPVRPEVTGTCVRYGGTIGAQSYESDWIRCD